MKNGHFNVCLRDETCRCEVRRYWIIFAITLATLLAEIFGGIISGSLALLSDAFHVAVDLSSAGIALYVAYEVKKSRLKEARMRALGGLISGILLLITVPFIMNEALERMNILETIQSKEMIIFAIIGLLGNALALWILHKSEENHVTHESLAAHIISDLLQSFGVVAVGFVIYSTGWMMIDSLSSFVIALLLLRLSVNVIRRSLRELKGL